MSSRLHSGVLGINGLDINLLSQEFEAEFVINSGAHAPERVTRAANSQSQGT